MSYSNFFKRACAVTSLFAAVSLPAIAQADDSATTTGSTVQSQHQDAAQAAQKVKATTSRWGSSAKNSIDNRFESFMGRHPEFAKYKDKLRKSAHKLANTTPKQDVNSAYDRTKAKIENRIASPYDKDKGTLTNTNNNSFAAAKAKMKSEMASYF